MKKKIKIKTKKEKEQALLSAKKKIKERGTVVSAKSFKTKVPKISLSGEISKFFDKELREEFASFLREKALASVSSPEKKEKVYKKEGVEPVSFKELTSFKNPLFSDPGKYDPSNSSYNPEEIDLETFDLMRRDYQVALALAFIKLPIVSLPWRIDCDDDEIKKTTEWAINKIWKDLIRSSLMALDYGFATHEKVWKRENVKIAIEDKEGKERVYHNGDLVYYLKIKPNHPATIKMRFDDKQNVIEILQESSLAKDEIRLPIRKCFLFTYDKEFGNPFGCSRLKNAYKVWYYQNLLLQFMMQYFERRGTPSTVVTAPPGMTQDSSGAEIDNMELAIKVATSLISSSVAAIPYQVNKEGRENMWNIEFLKDDARGVMFIEALTHLEHMILHSLFVPESLVSGESKSGGISVQGDLFLMSEKSLVNDLEDSITEQIILPFVEANYPPEKRKEAKFRLDPLDWSRKIALKEIFMEMLRNNDSMVQFGAPPLIMPSVEKMAQVLDVPIESFEDATGLSPEEYKKSFLARNKEARDPEKPEDPPKLPHDPRSKTRAKNVPQTEDRRRVNPTSRRSERGRENNPERKSK